jgi:hypothetical protein
MEAHSHGHVTSQHSKKLWPILSPSEGTSRLSFDRIVCLLQTTCTNKQSFQRQRECNGSFQKIAKDLSIIIQQNYSLDAKLSSLVKASQRRLMCWQLSKQRLYYYLIFKNLSIWRTTETSWNFTSVKTLSNYIVHKCLEKFLQTFNLRIS